MTAESNGLPCVEWGGRCVSRLLIGHNPFKGQSHHDRAMDAEMKDWYATEKGHDLEILHRCQASGINTAQFGAPAMHEILRRFHEAGGQIQWIATFYDPEGKDPEAELRAILAVEPKPIGIYYYGGRLDTLFLSGRIAEAADNLKRLRDTGLLVGAGSHLPDLMDRMEAERWDVDFYETCVYTVYADKKSAKIDRDNEVFDDADREKMFAFIKRASKPCIAFKVLGASRKCGTDREVEQALAYAYANIKDDDVVLVGMWQKYKDQVAQNVEIVRRLLAEPASGRFPPARKPVGT